MAPPIPTLAIVGHPNKGKSSIVSTLAQDPSVSISPVSGTTATNRTFPMVVDGHVLYKLIDTPGFQRARAALDWMQHHTSSAADHANVVREFVNQHTDNEKFSAECQLLTPILQGAGILYVIDGSTPYGPEYDAEMEILRWTGSPSMALINQTGCAEYFEDWQVPLSQYFKIVRVFNAQTADFDRQMQLLSGFAELSEPWRPSLLQAAEILRQRRQNQIKQTTLRIAEMLYAMLQMSERSAIVDAEDQTTIDRCINKFQQKLVNMETVCRKDVEQIFNYQKLERHEQNIQIFSEDLFSEHTWKLFGLSRDQLVATGIIGGAAGGAVLDIGSGGLTAFLGSGIGAIIGGVTTWFGSKQLINTRIMGLPMGGNEVVVGPVSNPNFPWVLMGRALTHLKYICTRTHAMRDVLAVDHKIEPDFYAHLSMHNKKFLQRFFTMAKSDKASNPGDLLQVSEILTKLVQSD